MMKLTFSPHRPTLAPQLSSWQLRSHHELGDLERAPVGLTAPFPVTIHILCSTAFLLSLPTKPRGFCLSQEVGMQQAAPSLGILTLSLSTTPAVSLFPPEL